MADQHHQVLTLVQRPDEVEAAGTHEPELTLGGRHHRPGDAALEKETPAFIAWFEEHAGR